MGYIACRACIFRQIVWHEQLLKGQANDSKDLALEMTTVANQHALSMQSFAASM